MKLPLFFSPKFKCELTRLGQNNDGGYCIPKESLKNSKVIYGFGLGDDWSFEQEFQKLSGAKIICYDGNVNFRFWFTRFCRDLIDFIILKQSLKNYKRLITYFYYKSFFNKHNRVHEKKNIIPLKKDIQTRFQKKETDLNEILKNQNDFNFFLKVDIEQHEYRILDQIIKYQSRLTGLVIEFHECDLHLDKIRNFIDIFELQLVHIHVNNFGITNEFDMATVIELTFSPKNYNVIRDKNDNKFPVNNLDQPNDKLKKDEQIIFI